MTCIVPQSQKSTRAPATYLQVPPLPSAPVEAMGNHAPNRVVASYRQTIPNKENPSRHGFIGFATIERCWLIAAGEVVSQLHSPSPLCRIVLSTESPAFSPLPGVPPCLLPCLPLCCLPSQQLSCGVGRVKKIWAVAPVSNATYINIVGLDRVWWGGQ